MRFVRKQIRYRVLNRVGDQVYDIIMGALWDYVGYRIGPPAPRNATHSAREQLREKLKRDQK